MPRVPDLDADRHSDVDEPDRLRIVSGAAKGDEHESARTLEPADTEANSGLLDELLDLDGRSSSRPVPAEAAVSVASTSTGPHTPSTRVGRLVDWAPGQGPTVEFAGNDRGPLEARSIIPLHPSLVAAAIADCRGVLLTFEDGRPDAPIITGLLQPLIHTEQDDEPEPELELPDGDADGEPGEVELEPTDGSLDARVDGRRVEIEAADEIVLRCGQASIVMRRNGRVVIRGTYVETRSRGVNRVKGGSVEIN
jgi:hypothetical protein